MRTAAPLLAGLLLLAGIPGTAQSDTRGELLRLLNVERQKVGAPPLRLSPPLSRAAEEHAAELAARGSMRLQASSAAEMRQRLERAGYEAHAWTESLAMTPGDPETAIRNWRQGDAESYRRAMSPEFRDIGIGLDRLRGTPLYIFLFAVPESDYFARGTSGLGDLERVRAEVLARVNEARIKAGVAPLRASSRLDRAAQRHAEDMLARGYFAHESPEGKTVRQRAREADYDWRAIGENLAEGQFSAEEVVDNWLRSPDHRRNILDPGFKEMGLGVARGRGGRRYRVLWAQVLGAR